jgi:hypothetical protein
VRNRPTGAVALRGHGRGRQQHVAIEEPDKSSGQRQEARDRAPNCKLEVHFWITEKARCKMGEAFGAAVGDGFWMNSDDF